MTNFQDVNVLVIEDEPMDSEVLASILSRLNITYEVINDGTLILDSLDELSDLDVIFLDLNLPNLDGFEVFDAIKADDRVSHIPIVAYSSHANEMKTAHDKGFSGFMAKPVDSEAFADNLAAILNGEEVWE